MRLIAENLGGERGGNRIFSGLNFELGNGDCLVVTGDNGSGKSTLLRIVAGLLPPAAGNIVFEAAGDAFPTLASASHYLGHDNAMKTALTVRENLKFWQVFCGAAEFDVDDALGTVGLDAIGHLPFAYLSTGQKRRVAIARLLVSSRPLWLLDEPTAGLDKVSERRFAGLLQAHLEDGGMAIAATHVDLGLTQAKMLDMGAGA